MPDGKTEELFIALSPEFVRLLDGHPSFGQTGITLTFHDGEIVKIEHLRSVSHKLAPKGGRG